MLFRSSLNKMSEHFDRAYEQKLPASADFRYYQEKDITVLHAGTSYWQMVSIGQGMRTVCFTAAFGHYGRKVQRRQHDEM